MDKWICRKLSNKGSNNVSR